MLTKTNVKKIKSKKLKKVKTNKKNNINRKKNTKIKYKKGGSNKKNTFGPNPPPGSIVEEDFPFVTGNNELPRGAIVPQQQACNELDDLNIYIRSNATLERLEYIGGGIPNAVYLDKDIWKIIKFPKHRNSDKPILSITDNLMGEGEGEDQQINFNDFISNINKYPVLEPFRNILIDTANIFLVIKDLSTFLNIQGYSFYPTIFNGYNNTMCISQVYEYHPYLKKIKSDENVVRKYKDSFIDVIRDFKELNLKEYVHGDMKNCNNIEFVPESGFKVIDIEAIKPRFQNIMSLQSILDYEEYIFIDLFQIIRCLNKNNFNIDEKHFKEIIDLNLKIVGNNMMVVKEMKKEDYYFLEDDLLTGSKWLKKTLNTPLNKDVTYDWGLSKETIISSINILTELLYDNLISRVDNHE